MPVGDYLRDPIQVPIDRLYPDPNNPRLGRDDKPGYRDAGALFDDEVRARIFDELGNEPFAVADLADAIVGQGWMAIDSIIVWSHPKRPKDYVVLEGNRRRVALDRIRTTDFARANKKLERMQSKPGGYDAQEITAQKRLVTDLDRIIKSTDKLTVIPIAAANVEELERKLPRILAVRHITGAKEWGNFAEDLWLLERYRQLFEDKHGKTTGLFWDAELIDRVAHEASLGTTTTKRQLKAARWFSHFKAEWEDQLPQGEEFRKTDYYLFEIISRKPWLREQLGIGENDLAIPEQGETALFKWVFAKPRGKKDDADSNPNVFYRHENARLWAEIKEYDDTNGTSFASRFDVEKPDSAPTMRVVEAEYLTHKARAKPSVALDALLRHLTELKAEHLAAEGEFLRAQLVKTQEMAEKFIKMIDAAGA